MTDELAMPLVEYAGRKSHWPERVYYGLKGITWLRIGIIAALMVLLFWPNLRRLWLKTNPVTGEANWGHSFFVPLIGLYYLYLNREALLSRARPQILSFQQKALGVWLQLQLAIWGVVFLAWAYYPVVFDDWRRRLLIQGPAGALAALSLLYLFTWGSLRGPRAMRLRDIVRALADRSASWFGFCAMLWGIVFYAWSIWPGQNDFFKDCAMVVTLFGVVLFLCGWAVMRVTWFPIAFLTCAIPWPGLVYSWVAMPLQELAASVAAGVLSATGVQAMRTGTKLLIGQGANLRVLNVAEACAGLKSLMTFVSVGAAVGFLSARPLWQKVLITAWAVPIAIFCNVIRVTGQGLLDHYVSYELSNSFAHQFVGMIMLIPAFFMILLVAWVLDNLFIEEADKHGIRGRTAKSAGTATDLVIEIPLPGMPAKRPVPPPAETPTEHTTELVAATMRLTSSRSSRSVRAAAGGAQAATRSTRTATPAPPAESRHEKPEPPSHVEAADGDAHADPERR
jgi:exosortase